jgi:TIR domain
MRDKVRNYTDEKGLDNKEKASTEEKTAVLIAGKIIRELEEILLTKEASDLSAAKTSGPVISSNIEASSLSDQRPRVIHAAQPLHEREYDAFLSCKDTNRMVVDHIYEWMNRVANIEDMWYDAYNLEPNDNVEEILPKIIGQCRSIIIILSKNSIDWARKEYEAALDQQRRYKDFRIVPISIEQHEPPDFLSTGKIIRLYNGRLDLDTANKLLTNLYYNDIGREFKKKEIYVSRTWQKDDAKLANYVCDLLVMAGFRLIGDSKNQKFYYGDRVKSIISSCGGFVSILSDRGEGSTSEWMLNEIKIATELKLPNFIVAEPTVRLDDEIDKIEIDKIAIRLAANSAEEIGVSTLQRNIEKLQEDWNPPQQERYIFFATDFCPANSRRNQLVKEHIERITSMPCVIGQDIMEDHLQKAISDKISGAFIVIADISEDNRNTLIEAGIARGAGRKLHPLARKSNNRPPFMLSDLEVRPFTDDLELLGRIHRIAYQYRRRVLNYELSY